MSINTSITIMNELAPVYNSGPIAVGSSYKCPVCAKEYKQEKSCIKHIEKMNCYSLHDLFSSTEFESRAYDVFRELIKLENPKAYITYTIFSKSPSYNSCMRFVLFAADNEIDDKGLYLSWLMDIKNCKRVNLILKESVNLEKLREYRLWLQKHHKFVDSASFYEKYKDSLIDDDDFLVRSVEKSHIALEYLIDKDDYPIRDKYENMPIAYRFRLDAIMDSI